MDASLAVRFAVLAHDLGKARTPQEKWPAHHGHEHLGLEPIEALCARLKVPTQLRELALIVSKFHTHVHRALELKPGTALQLFEETDAFRRPERFAEFLTACECDARGRLGLEDRPYPQADSLRAAIAAVLPVSLTENERQGLAGPAFGDKLRAKRLAVLTALRSSVPEDP
jgi:tRNA nucleotidyltransferase (CCA-adding enzyme)